MKKLSVLFFALAFAIAASLSSSYAKPPKGDMGKGKGMCPRGDGHCPMFGNIDKMKKDLALSDEQVNKIKAINESYKKQFTELREKIVPKRDELHKLLMADEVDTKAVRELLVEMSNTHVEIRMLGINHRIDADKVLNPDQKKKHKEIMKERMGKGMKSYKGMKGKEGMGPCPCPCRGGMPMPME